MCMQNKGNWGLLMANLRIRKSFDSQIWHSQIRNYLLTFAAMTEKILILDFGSQYTQLIARAVREANVYSEIAPFNKEIAFDASLKGIILSGSPFSVNEANAPDVDVNSMQQKLPVLGICYGAQLTAKKFGGE